MLKINNLTEASIDSLKIRIPLFSLDSYDLDITRDIQQFANYEFDVIDREFKTNRKTYEFDNYKLTANIFRVNGIDCLILLVNSKQVGYKYFEGITNDTIKIIYNLCIHNQVMKCSYEMFRQSAVTDIDIKKDFRFDTLPDYKQMLEGMKVMSVKSNLRDKGHRPFNDKGNLGLEFGTRVTTSAISNPFTKVYFKQKELETNSFDFADRYLSDVDYKNVFRIETTIKDKRHFDSFKLGLNDLTLDVILNLTTEEKDIILANAFNRHLLPRKRFVISKNEELNPTDQSYLSIITSLVNAGSHDFDEVLNLLIKDIDCRKAKSRKKKQITTLYNNNYKPNIYHKRAENVEKFYDQIGWN